jgi:hypothetical protein
MPKLNKTLLPQEKIKEHSKYALSSDLIKFSFKYLAYSDKFSLNKADNNYIIKLMERLKNVSSIAISDFRNNKSKALRAHMHDWRRTTEKDGFNCLNDQLKQCEAWQFQLSSNEHGRVHGILLDETFYIVWFDLDHALYQ